MKRTMNQVMMGLMMMSSIIVMGQAKIDEQRMDQDIEIAENALSTMLRQQTGKRIFFPMEVNGSYTAGYGVTLRMPRASSLRMIMGSVGGPGMSYTYSYSNSDDAQMNRATEERYAADRAREEAMDAREKAGRAREEAMDAKERAEIEQRARKDKREREVIKPRIAITAPRGTRMDMDSARASADELFISVSKNFLANYGDLISQLKPEEKIILTNRSEDFEGGFFQWQDGDARRSLVSVEVKKDDINQLKQGKITRDQFMSRLKVINTESADALDPDLEVLSSMFSRLYREDLSKTYYVQGNVSYERLKDFGVIYYMKVYSSNQNEELFSIPTIGMHDLSQTERDKKVKELYPRFESDLKSNLVEYGRTLQSLKDDEQVVMKVKLTKCTGCGIPESIELSIKNAALKDYSTGKATKDATLGKVSVKKTGEQ